VHYSGILVVTRPGVLDQCVETLEGLPGVEVHFSYPDSGRIIAVQETGTVREQEEGLRRIQALPGVATAALVEHRIEDDAPSDRQATRGSR
jgi:nitrate reductase NapAB chaperone NapD